MRTTKDLHTYYFQLQEFYGFVSDHTPLEYNKENNNQIPEHILTIMHESLKGYPLPLEVYNCCVCPLPKPCHDNFASCKKRIGVLARKNR